MTSLYRNRKRAARCPACGERLVYPLPPRCPLCDLDFGDTRATGIDVTPYAQALSHGRPGWRVMCEWVWFAGSERLKHLAMMRRSAASARFARINLLLLALGASLVQVRDYGWHRPELETTGSASPSGHGWFHVAGTPRPLSTGDALEAPIDLWWNPVQTLLVTFITAASGWVLMSVLTALIRKGVTRAHKPPYRNEERMTAATHYGTAWSIPMCLAGLVVALTPLAFIGAVERWPWYPSVRGFELSAGVVAGFGAIMWWIWLIHLGATAPAKTRTRVIAFFVLATPMAVAAAAVGWWLALDQLYDPLFEALGIAFGHG